MPNLQNFKGSSFCRSLGRSLGPKLRPNQDSVDLWHSAMNKYIKLALIHFIMCSWMLSSNEKTTLSPVYSNKWNYYLISK